MLESYVDSQPIIYKMIVNSIHKDRISHAYLIETNYNPKGFDFALSFAKFLLCPSNKTKNDDCVSCTQCHRIDDRCFSELKILKSETLQIKKEQINDLQKEFSLKSVESKRKVYIIEEAEKLNDSSSASLLKFLEEPEDNIVAILITPNKNLLLSTILSRCQVISMKSNQTNKPTIEEELCDLLSIGENEKLQFLQDENNKLKIESAIKFLKMIENKGIDSILFINKNWSKIFANKEDYLFAFNLFIIIYKRSIESKLGIYKDSYEQLQEIIEKNTISSLCSKLELVLSYKEKIKANLNLNMLMDKFIIEMEDLKC